MKEKKSLQALPSLQTLFHLFIDDHVILVLRHLLAVGELDNDLTTQVLDNRSLCLTSSGIKQGAETSYDTLQLLHVYCYHIRSSLLAECDWIDAEVRVLCLILIFIDEVHHILFTSSLQRDTCLLTPQLDGITKGGVSTLTILKEFSVCSDVALLGEEVVLIVRVEDVATWLNFSPTDGKFIAKSLVQLVKKHVA